VRENAGTIGAESFAKLGLSRNDAIDETHFCFVLVNQIPRIDIGAPANAIEYHPALLAHADENGGSGGHTPETVMLMPPSQLKASPTSASDTEELLESDLSDDDGLLSDDDSFDCSDSDSDDVPVMSLADQAENEKFGLEYEGPKLSDEHAARLLALMLHANTCPCR
jgi:hypothetical protein